MEKDRKENDILIKQVLNQIFIFSNPLLHQYLTALPIDWFFGASLYVSYLYQLNCLFFSPIKFPSGLNTIFTCVLSLPQVTELHSKMTTLLREKKEALLLTTKIQEQYNTLTSELKAKVKHAACLPPYISNKNVFYFSLCHNLL